MIHALNGTPERCHVERSRSGAKRNSGGVETSLPLHNSALGMLAPRGMTVE